MRLEFEGSAQNVADIFEHERIEVLVRVGGMARRAVARNSLGAVIMNIERKSGV
jgi:hypothetical protein